MRQSRTTKGQSRKVTIAQASRMMRRRADVDAFLAEIRKAQGSRSFLLRLAV